MGETLLFMHQLWELMHALQVRSKRMARTLGVTGPQRLVIRLVGQFPNITARDLSTTLGMHPSTLTGVLSRLERMKLIERTIDPKDRRRARFSLTQAGKDIDRVRRGTVEGAVRRALSRADASTIEKSSVMLGLLVTELSRIEPVTRSR
jgi:DNA-binding MarR family transcriptional regulator